MAAVKLIQLDGKLPNLALMKLAHWHRAKGDTVTLATTPQPDLWAQGPFQHVYASGIFTNSMKDLEYIRAHIPHAVTGGTADPEHLDITVETTIGEEEYEHYDYSIYPHYPWSMGFTQRGCRLSCGFCIVPKKEGKPKSVNTIRSIWRPGTPKCVLLIDNDFFGQDKDQWQARIEELREGNFRVAFSQGINIRMINDESAQALASVQYRDDQFERRRLYTAWDNLGQEKVFFKGVQKLNEAGIPTKHLMVYMLTGYKKDETMEEILHRYNELRAAGCKPYPMVYGNSAILKTFQRWVIGRYAEFIPWEEFHKTAPTPGEDEIMPTLPDSHQVAQALTDELGTNTERSPKFDLPTLTKALNKATGGYWSIRYAQASAKQSGLQELFKLPINIGDSPTLTVNAELTIHTLHGPVVRQGTATGQADNDHDHRRLREKALASAIQTLLVE